MSAAEPLCDIIIPAKNSPWWLAACLEELRRNSTKEERGKTIVVDDGSTPESFDFFTRICTWTEDVMLVRNGGRPGFGGACNFGAAFSRAPYMLFLNTDCLITHGTLRKLAEACQFDPGIGMSCPLSNNSPTLTLPMHPGISYARMNEMLEQGAAGAPRDAVALEACTVVGNCMLISRKCWEKTGEFDEEWGLGYGEETDFQMRAMEQGFRGVVLVNTYVYHFGSATFRYETDLDKLREKNLKMFHSKWEKPFKDLFTRCRARDPVSIAASNLASTIPDSKTHDVLFLLPGISKDLEGTDTIVDISNQLNRNGIVTACAVIGPFETASLGSYPEPLFSGVLHFENEMEFLAAEKSPRILVSTDSTTALTASVFAHLRGVPVIDLIHRHEHCEQNGRRYNYAAACQAMVHSAIVTSEDLEHSLRARSSAAKINVFPPGVDRIIHAPRKHWMNPAFEDGRLRVGFLLDNVPDRGQFILMDVLRRLAGHASKLGVTFLASKNYSIPVAWDGHPDARVVVLPADRMTVARALSECDIFVDASLHPGCNPAILGAMACGNAVVASDSPGGHAFVKDGVNGILVARVNKPEAYTAAILKLVADKELLLSCKKQALKTGEEWDSGQRKAEIEAFFWARLEEEREQQGGRRMDVLQQFAKEVFARIASRHRARLQEYDRFCIQQREQIEEYDALCLSLRREIATLNELCRAQRAELARLKPGLVLAADRWAR